MKHAIFTISYTLLLLTESFSQAPSSVIPDRARDLTPEALSAVIVISGEKGSGTGFFCRNKDRVFVITNQHVLAGNSNVEFKTQRGEAIPMKAIYVAESADIVIIEPRNIPEYVVPLEVLETPESNVTKDDAVVIPGNSKGDGVITQTQGKLVGFGPQRVEVDNPVYPGNSGSPIIDLESGKVIGVLTEAKLISLNAFEKASFRSKQSSIKSEIRYFGHRIDSVEKWTPLDWKSFQESDRLLEQSWNELLYIDSYFTDSSDAYKNFRELHEAANSHLEIWESASHSEADKIKALNGFMRHISSMAQKARRRVEQRQFAYIHRSKFKDIADLSERLTGGTEIASRDIDLIVVLLQRGN